MPSQPAYNRNPRVLPSTHWSEIRRLAAGDREAADRLFLRYRDPIVLLLRLRGHAEADAEDIAHDVLHHLLRYDQFRKADPARGRFRGLLTAVICHREAAFLKDTLYDRLPEGRKHLSIHDALGELDPDFAEMLAGPEPPDPEADVETGLFHAILSTALLRLTQTDEASFTTIRTLAIERRSQTEVAREWGISQPAVAKRFKQAREALVRELNAALCAHGMFEPVGDGDLARLRALVDRFLRR